MGVAYLTFSWRVHHADVIPDLALRHGEAVAVEDGAEHRALIHALHTTCASKGGSVKATVGMLGRRGGRGDGTSIFILI